MEDGLKWDSSRVASSFLVGQLGVGNVIGGTGLGGREQFDAYVQVLEMPGIHLATVCCLGEMTGLEGVGDQRHEATYE